MSKKLRLKEMSHKKLRKLAKGLAKSLKKTKMDLDTSEMSDSTGRGKLEDARELIDTIYNKLNECMPLIGCKRVPKPEVAIERIKAKLEEYRTRNPHEQMVKNLEESLVVMNEHVQEQRESIAQLNSELSTERGNRHQDNEEWRKALEESGVQFKKVQAEHLKALYERDNRIQELELALDFTDKTTVKKQSYIGDMPDNLNMGVDGQLKEIQLIGEGEEVDEAATWARRNGHHQPTGNPEPSRMEGVRIKSADEISAENMEKYQELVECEHPDCTVIGPGIAQCTSCGKHI